MARPPVPVRVVVARACFPTGMLGHYTRRLADAGLVAVLTTTSPPRLAAPGGGEPLVGTNPISIAVPSSRGEPVVVDVSPAKETHGDVLAGLATEADVVPFGGEKAYKAFALAVGLELLIGSLAGDDAHGAFLLAAQPAYDPVPCLRARAGGIRLPGDA